MLRSLTRSHPASALVPRSATTTMLAAGKRLGPYEIVSPLGAGAMGEVYRARDARLQRDVAVKILPDAFVDDRERLERFEQEAHAAGRLNHPNIVAVYDVGAEDGVPFVVTELLDGQTLRERLAAGPLAVRRAIELALQLAQGLAAAHDHGIIHRDLKPENLFVTRDGRLKILDFGLAKVTAPKDGAGNAGPARVGNLTGSQVILGTAGYMAPEQVLGQTADLRSDLFAFGVILYEMLTGMRAFTGDSSIQSMAAILNTEPPPVSNARMDLPAGLDRIVERCLEKDPARRFQSAHDLAFVLESLQEGPGGTREHAVIRAAPRRRAGWIVAAAGLVLGVVIGVAVAKLAFRPAPPEVARFSIAVPEGSTVNGNGGDVVISPDGRMVVLAAIDSSGVQHLWIRAIDSLATRKLPGTDTGYLPFWSPDSRFIAFFANGKLLRIPAAGGAVQEICDAPSGRGGSWSRRGEIVFAPGSSGGLFRVPAAGGAPVALTHPDSTRNETGHRFPQFLPDGRHVMFASLPGRHGTFDICVTALDSKSVKVVMTSASMPVCAPPGWLLFSRNGQLVAQRFDAGSLRLQGDSAPLGEAGGHSTFDSEPAVSVSTTGTLVYPSAGLPNTELVWFDLEGRRHGTIPMPPGHYVNLQISPDGRRVAVERRNSSASMDIWIAEIERGIATRIIFEPGVNLAPVWSPDGGALVYSSNRAGPYDLYVRRLSGSGQDEALPKSNAAFKVPLVWSSDGRFILEQSFETATSWDILMLELGGEKTASALLQGLANEGLALLSPDGRWLSYLSDQSGSPQFYAQPFPGPGEKYQLSVRGACFANTVANPVWLRGGRMFAYIGPDCLTLMATDVTEGPPFRASTPRPLFKLPVGIEGLAATPAGDRLLATVPSGTGIPSTITLVENWSTRVGR
jgi:Tol biopolymer transport system component